MSLNTVSVNLSNLQACEENIRKIHNHDGLEELAASIKSHGLLQPLLVRADDNGKVIAGGRRLAALNLLAARGDIANDIQIPCNIAQEGADNSELSLAENVVREAMHPIDQAIAFSELVDKGIRIDEIATRFGETPSLVNKRVALARLSPKVIERFRAGEMSLSQAQAFTLVNDHSAQESVLENFDEDDDPSDIRDALTDDGFVRADDKRVVFIGIEAYTEAGGTVSKDLFAEDDRGTYLHDENILDELTDKKLAEIAEELRQEGWSWVDAERSFNHNKYFSYTRSRPQTRPYTDAENITLKDLEEREKELQEIHDAAKHGSEEERNAGIDLDKIGEQLAALEESTKTWSDRQKAKSGAVVSIDYYGKLEIVRGMVKPKVTKIAAKSKFESDDNNVGSQATEKSIPDVVEISKNLIETLSAHRSAAIGYLMAKNIRVALAFLAYEFLSRTNHDIIEYNYMLKATFSATHYPASVSEKGVCKGLDNLEALRADLMGALPEAADEQIDRRKYSKDILAWLLEQDIDTLTQYVALAVGMSVNTISQNPDAASDFGSASMGEALSLNMNEYFIPDAANFFVKLSALQILAVLQQAGVEVIDDWKNLKKKDLALLAEGELHAHAPLWLPSVMVADTKHRDEDQHVEEETEEYDDDNTSNDDEEDYTDEG